MQEGKNQLMHSVTVQINGISTAQMILHGKLRH